MSEVTIKQLAGVLSLSSARLLAQLREAGMVFTDPEQTITSTDKVRLLGFLRRTHGLPDKDAGAEEAIASIDLLEPTSGVEEETEDINIVIDRPFDPERIKVKTVGRTVDLMLRRIKHNEIDLAPEFQRRARVWDITKKSRLIESLLLRIPLPVFYVAANDLEHWAVVDGLQRLTTILDFVNNDYHLKGMEYLVQLNGKVFSGASGLPRPMQRRIEETELVIHVIEPGTPEAVMINIFKRINTGGVPLTGQEIRNALNKGPARELLKDLASSPEFLSATSNSVSDARMDAQECVLRFLAFRLVDWTFYQSNDLDGYLNKTMRELNELSAAERQSHSNDFIRAMNAAHQIFGDDAFRKRYSVDIRRRNPVSKALFETWSVNLAKRTNAELEKLVSKKIDLSRAFATLMSEDRFFDVSISYSTGVPQRVQKRFSAVEKIINEVLQ